MASAGFVRDEVILALDVLYSSENNKVSANSEDMEELSSLLNRLPIHRVKGRRSDFRSPSGIVKQLNLFKKSCDFGIKNIDVGACFFDVAFEYENRIDELHSIAESIRRNENGFTEEFGSLREDTGFPEGNLLGHLHKVIEARDGSRVPVGECCQICNANPGLYYKSCGQLLKNHLLVKPTMLDFRKKYGANYFITVCPTCHEALHHYRPWLTNDNYGELLR